MSSSHLMSYHCSINALGLISASSLTVFNTAQCPYNVSDQGETGVTEDPLEARARARARTRAQQGEAESEDVSTLQVDIGDGAGENRDMFYLPEMGDMPEFDLPEDLELPNIASDLQVWYQNYENIVLYE